MKKYLKIGFIPAGMLALAACSNSAPPGPATISDSSADHTGNTAKGDNVSAATPGYMSLQNADYAVAVTQFVASNNATPHSAYDELDLGVAYQHQGRMDLAEPWYRAAMTDGHGVVATTTTTELSRGHTVEEIACQNLAMGLRPAAVGEVATPCQTTLTVGVVSSTAQVTTSYRGETTFNTYFDFDKATLSAGGRANIDSAAGLIRANPALRVMIVGKASNVGSDAYNMILSEIGANAIRDAMVADGVPTASIDVRWVGMRELPVAEQAGYREPLNRVVQTTVN
jgi:outer membrane protein OmpA-like peptidoglycan-associated protein